MSDLAVTVSTAQVRVGGPEPATLTVSVTDTGGRGGRVVLGAYGAAELVRVPWASVEREVRDLAPGATEQFAVTFEADRVPPGSTVVRFVASPSSGAPDGYAEQAATVTVSAPEPQVAPARAGRPWWLLVAVAVLVLAVAGVGTGLALRGRGAPGGATPTPSGSTTTTATTPCQPGYVPRLTRPSDGVCVTPASAAQVRYDDDPAVQDTRKPTPRGGPYGPETCLQGWVWRDAYSGDTICVDGATRDRTHQENLDAALHAA